MHILQDGSHKYTLSFFAWGGKLTLFLKIENCQFPPWVNFLSLNEKKADLPRNGNLGSGTCECGNERKWNYCERITCNFHFLPGQQNTITPTFLSLSLSHSLLTAIENDLSSTLLTRLGWYIYNCFYSLSFLSPSLALPSLANLKLSEWRNSSM